ncbi:MAG: 6-bladed beta-propeller [Tannerella sp.]|nr:6-bladed beta-propeller [Tannerella sp.]
MKKTKMTFAIILLVVLTGCGSGKHSTDDFITVDVTASYPKKELILQDFMDVEYIPLETNDEFITQGIVLYVSRKYILTRNQGMDGVIFIFDRNGQGIRKINRKGQGPEDYTFINSLVLDEDEGEIFVHDYSQSKILVYDLNGKFSRSLKYNIDDDTLKYSDLQNYDKEHLIGYDATGDFHEARQFYHLIISKKDGSIVRKIQVPFKEKKTTMIQGQEGEVFYTAFVPFNSIFPYRNEWILSQPSSDTIYRVRSDFSTFPIIARIPPIQSMSPEVFLSPKLLTERYYFMVSSEKKAEFINDFVRIPQTQLVYDKQENTIFEYSVYNDDFSNRKQIGIGTPVNTEIAFWQKLDAYQLVEAYGKGELKGRLKEISAGLEEEDNAVIMLVKYKQ